MTVPAVVAEVALVAEVAVAAFPPMERFATGVVEVITNGAVPVVAVEVICPETVSPVSVPTEVKEEPVTVELSEAPVSVPAGAADKVASPP